MSILVLFLTLAPLEDLIFKNGATKPIRGTVVSEDIQAVKYRAAGINQTLELDASQVDRIEYDDAPEAFTKGMEYLKKGDAENAIASFKVAKQSKSRNDWVKIYATFELGMAQAMLGAKASAHYRAAADSFAELMKDHPENRYLPQALKRWGECLAGAGQADEAAKIYDQLEQTAKNKKLGLRWEALAKLGKADAYSLNGDSAKAESAYQDAGRFASSNASAQKDPAIVKLLESIASRAELARGDSLLRGKNFADARRFFEQILANRGAGPEAHAGALNGLGEVMLGENRAAEALEQFAKVRVLHYLQEDQCARATYYLGKCCLVLGDDEPGGKRKAREYFTEVTRRFQDSMWADKARAELQ